MPARTSRTSKSVSAATNAASKSSPEDKSTKQTKPPSLPRAARQPRGLSALDAASLVLAGLAAKESADGLTTPELIDRMRRARLWSSPSGKTPQATLYSAIIREIGQRRSESRFKRVASGRFAATPASKRAAKQTAGSTKIAPAAMVKETPSANTAAARNSRKRAVGARS